MFRYPILNHILFKYNTSDFIMVSIPSLDKFNFIKAVSLLCYFPVVNHVIGQSTITLNYEDDNFRIF